MMDIQVQGSRTLADAREIFSSCGKLKNSAAASKASPMVEISIPWLITCSSFITSEISRDDRSITGSTAEECILRLQFGRCRGGRTYALGTLATLFWESSETAVKEPAEFSPFPSITITVYIFEWLSSCLTTSPIYRVDQNSIPSTKSLILIQFQRMLFLLTPDRNLVYPSEPFVHRCIMA